MNMGADDYLTKPFEETDLLDAIELRLKKSAAIRAPKKIDHPDEEEVAFAAEITRWQGEKAVYHVITIGGDAAEAISMHERLRRLEFGARRGFGFGSVKVMASVGETRWKTSVFPSKTGEWWLLVGRKVLKAEDLVAGDRAQVELELL